MNFIKYILLLSLLAIVGACSKDDSSISCRFRHTTIIYMSAQNSLSLAASYDFEEIKQGTKLLKNTDDNIILYLDDANKPRIYCFNKKNSSNSNPQPVKTYSTDLDSSDPATLTNVLNYVAANYPSQSYGLVLWSHGTGWLPYISSYNAQNSKASIATLNKPQGFGIDVGENGNMSTDCNALGKLGNQMEIPDLANAIQKSTVFPEYIFFDACQMQCIEVAYALKDVTHYIIASPSTTSGYGIYYTHMIPDGFCAYPFTDDSINNMADIYYYDVMENPATKDLYEGQGCIMSVIKTHQLDSLANKTASFLPQVIQDKAYPNLNDVQTYTSFVHTKNPDYFDINSAMHKLLPDTQYDSWHKTLTDCVIHTRASSKFYHHSEGLWACFDDYDATTACGVSMFFPQEIYNQSNYYGNLNEMFTSTLWYQVAGWKQCGW